MSFRCLVFCFARKKLKEEQHENVVCAKSTALFNGEKIKKNYFWHFFFTNFYRNCRIQEALRAFY